MIFARVNVLTAANAGMNNYIGVDIIPRWLTYDYVSFHCLYGGCHRNESEKNQTSIDDSYVMVQM